MRKIIFIFIFVFVTGNAVADDVPAYERAIDSIVSKAEEPEGVVFEIVSAHNNFLLWALPEVQRLSNRLHQKFPGVKIVVVSHGSEMFALTSEGQKKQPALKQQLESLSENEIDVHVCGTLAEMRHVSHESFPENVEVATHGPSEINKYIDLGFVHIKLSRQ